MKTPFSLIHRLLAYLVSGIYFAESLSPSLYLLLLVFCIYVLSCYRGNWVFQELFLALVWTLVGAYLMHQRPQVTDWPELAVVKITDYGGRSPKRYRFSAEGLGGSIVLYTKDSLENGGVYAARLKLFDSVYSGSTTRAFVNDYIQIEPPKSPTLRAAIVERWRKLGIGHEQLGFLANVIVGERGLISAKVKAQFRQLGASHVLAISGLHVGVLYALLNGLIFFLPQPYRRVLLLICLWTYAYVAAFSPSVVRATLIFSLYAIALSARRIPSKAQLLTVSAFLSLLIDPQLLFDIGFLMSYSAVAAIVICLKPLRAFEPKHIWLRYGYYLVGVSIAAQLGVTPIALVIFKTLSPWFLVGSLALVPLMPLVLGSGLLGLTSSVAAQLCDQLITQLLRLVDYLEKQLSEPLIIEGFDKTFALMYYGLFALLMYITHQALDKRRGEQHHYP